MRRSTSRTASGRTCSWGTLQEVFQDAAQNYYPTEGSGFSPMVFFDADGFWSRDLPVEPLLAGLYRLGGKEQEYRENVLFTRDVDAVVDFLKARAPSPAQVHNAMKKLGMLPVAEQAALKGPAASGWTGRVR
jgi:hypothetical protein